MLEALKAAAESALETSISTADVVVPFPTSEGFRDLLLSACSSNSLQVPKLAQTPAGIWAARTYNISGICSNEPGGPIDPPQLVLMIEYTRAALTGLIGFGGLWII